MNGLLLDPLSAAVGSRKRIASRGGSGASGRSPPQQTNEAKQSISHGNPPIEPARWFKSRVTAPRPERRAADVRVFPLARFEPAAPKFKGSHLNSGSSSPAACCANPTASTASGGPFTRSRRPRRPIARPPTIILAPQRGRRRLRSRGHLSTTEISGRQFLTGPPWRPRYDSPAGVRAKPERTG